MTSRFGTPKTRKNDINTRTYSCLKLEVEPMIYEKIRKGSLSSLRGITTGV